MPESTQPFDRLLQSLETLVRPAAHDPNRADPDNHAAPTREPDPPDAIDRILAAAPRRTRVRSLRDAPVVARFREDLTHGLIRVDTANVLFRIITDLINLHTGAG